MAKYSFEFKKQIVKEYLEGNGGYKYLACKYNVSSYNNVKKWIMNYQQFGDQGLLRSRQSQNYTFEKKLAIVELYLTSELSYQEIALQEGICEPPLIAKWVSRFRAAGPEALRPHKKGRKVTLNKSRENTTVHSHKESIVDTSAEHVRELEDELLKLRIENAFLKELRRLRLEDEAKMRERRESSTVSEENSN